MLLILIKNKSKLKDNRPTIKYIVMTMSLIKIFLAKKYLIKVVLMSLMRCWVKGRMDLFLFMVILEQVRPLRWDYLIMWGKTVKE